MYYQSAIVVVVTILDFGDVQVIVRNGEIFNGL